MKSLVYLGIPALMCAAASASPVVFSVAGADPASITPTIDAFRSAISLGGGVNPTGGPFTTGRREINWDAAGLDAFASPGLMPRDFFNNQVKRGAVFDSSGTGVMVSKRNAGGDLTDPALRFGDIDPAYASEFQAFSQQRLFAGAGATDITTHFFVPSDPGAIATVNGFGVVFTDVDLGGLSGIDFYDAQGQLLKHATAACSESGGLSFLGVFFDAGERVASVRITAGNLALGAGHLDHGEFDVVATDDFIYGEPIGVPGPGSLALAAAGVPFLARGRRR